MKTGSKKLFLSTAALMFVISSALESRATSIVAHKTQDSVFLAADSKMTLIDPKGTTSRTDSKITHLDKLICFAGTGISEYTDTRLYVSNTAKLAYAKSKNLLECVGNFEHDLAPALESTLEDIRDKKPEVYRTKLGPGKHAVDAIFCGIENGQPRLYARQFINECVNGKIKVGIHGAENDSLPGALIIAGQHDNAAAFFKLHPTMLIDMGEFAGLTKLIQLEIDAGCDDVGPPIQVLRIDSSGIHGP